MRVAESHGRDMYMELPPSYKHVGMFKTPVAKLRVALYGSKQGALKWYLKLCMCLKDLGLNRTHSDWGIFYAHIGHDILILASHVDDCTLTVTTMTVPTPIRPIPTCLCPS